MATLIKINYRTVDGCRQYKSYKTLAGAAKWFSEWFGDVYDFGPGAYSAVTFDGIGRATIDGVVDGRRVSFEDLRADNEEGK